MRQEFSGYYSPTEREFEELWTECTFVFDANMLINLYRFPKDSREAMLKIMENVKERIWIPHQVALEYHKHLHEEIYNQKKAYTKFKEQCNESVSKLIDELAGLRHSNLESEGIEGILNQCLIDIEEELSKQHESQPDLLEIQNKVTHLIGNNVGVPFTPDRLKELYEIGSVRYQAKIPPGYKDLKEKEGETTLHNGVTYKDEYGDLVYWQQILDKARDEDSIKSVILVTDDSKEDWVYKVKGEKKGPHPELVHEFKKECKGKQFYLYNSERFLEYAKKRLKLDDSYLDNDKVTGAIKGIKELKKHDDEVKLSNQRNNAKSIDVKILDNSVLEAIHINEDFPGIDPKFKLSFMVSLEDGIDDEEYSNFRNSLKRFMKIIYGNDIKIYYKFNMDLGGTHYYSLDIEGTKKFPDSMIQVLNDLAQSAFPFKDASIVITE
ncbi:PIN domain-containing protein [Paenibacillus amylolyticus]|uniref:PIN domain-containing protein n=1 Tax=Paenibacillus amylolyticus TaxID=1451 RepID=UPI003D952A13